MEKKTEVDLNTFTCQILKGKYLVYNCVNGKYIDK